jgi:hypothetical protein
LPPKTDGRELLDFALRRNNSQRRNQMNQVTRNVDVITGDSAPTRLAFPRPLMNSLIRILIKLGILKEDIDYHLVRASMVIIFLFFGYQK